MNIDLIHKVIHLARHREYLYRVYLNTYFPNQAIINLVRQQCEDSSEYQEYNKCDTSLIKFMYEMSYEDILDIEALLFLGRGDEPSFLSAREYLADAYPNEDGKRMAIDYITSKAPLADYLTKGLERL